MPGASAKSRVRAIESASNRPWRKRFWGEPARSAQLGAPDEGAGRRGRRRPSLGSASDDASGQPARDLARLRHGGDKDGAADAAQWPCSAHRLGCTSRHLGESWNVIGSERQPRRLKVGVLFVPRQALGRRDPSADVKLPSPLYKVLSSVFATGLIGRRLASPGHCWTLMELPYEAPHMTRMSYATGHWSNSRLGEARGRLRPPDTYVETTAQRTWDAVVASGATDTMLAANRSRGCDLAIHEAKAVLDRVGGRGRSAYLSPVPLSVFRDIPHHAQVQQVKRNKKYARGRRVSFGFRAELTLPRRR